jgi:phosphoadenosine phosphosulfate reductase
VEHGHHRPEAGGDACRRLRRERDLRVSPHPRKDRGELGRQRHATLEWREGTFRIYPIVDWTDRDVGAYLKKHELPYHPMWDRGYVSIGDWHTTRPLHEVGEAEATRFLGLKRECGLHGLS